MRGTRYGFRSLRRRPTPLLPFLRRYFIFASKLSRRWNLVLHMINSSQAYSPNRPDTEQERVRPSLLLLIHSPFLSRLARLSARLNSKYLIQLRVVKRTRGHIIPYVYVSIRRGSGEQSTNLSLRAPQSSLPRAFYTRTLTPRLIGFYAPFPIR